MNSDSFNFEIGLAAGRGVGYRETVVLDLALAKNEVKLSTYQVLEHGTDVVGAATSRLNPGGLGEKVFNVGAEGFVQIEVERDNPASPTATAANLLAFGLREQDSVETVLSENFVRDCSGTINTAQQFDGFLFLAGELEMFSHERCLAMAVTQTSTKKRARSLFPSWRISDELLAGFGKSHGRATPGNS